MDRGTYNTLQKIGAGVGAVTAIVALITTWVVLPFRLAAAEVKIIELQVEMKMTREILIRIDENVKQLRALAPPPTATRGNA